MSETISFSFQDYLDYQEILNNSLENNSDTLFFNESYVHAAMVTKTLIDNAIKRDWGINMFCGEFSLFRNKFKEHIINIKENLKGDETALAKSDDFDKFDPYGDLIESLRSFVGVILQNMMLLRMMHTSPCIASLVLISI